MKIGVLGGTFNPIHVAHVAIAEAYADRLALDKVIFVPTYIPPHKKAKGIANAEDRLAMCRMAINGHERFVVCDYEIQQAGKSYTYKTLRYLRGQYPEATFYLLMGADMFLTVQDWRRSEELFKMAVLCAAQRAQGEMTVLDAHKRNLEVHGATCELIDMEPMPISSTFVREGLKAGQDVSEWLHPAVLRYIRDHRLYR